MSKALDVPRYKQRKNDYACGPVCIGMAVDYLRKRQNKKPLDFQESMTIFCETMNGNLLRTSGTSKKAINRTLRGLGCRVKELTGSYKTRISQIKNAIRKHHPVILSCRTDIGGDRYAHFIVVTDINEQHIYFNDPYPRRRNKVTHEKFVGRGESLCWGISKWGIEVS